MEIFIAFLALIIASATLYVQRQHNRMQMLPIVHFYYSLENSSEHSLVELKIINDGLGPALIKSLKVTCDEEEFIVENYSDLNNLICKQVPDAINVTTSLPLCLKANASETLYKYRVPKNSANSFKTANTELIVSSLYEDKVIVTNHGFTVESNPRDILFEKIEKSIRNLFK